MARLEEGGKTERTVHRGRSVGCVRGLAANGVRLDRVLVFAQLRGLFLLFPFLLRLHGRARNALTSTLKSLALSVSKSSFVSAPLGLRPVTSLRRSTRRVRFHPLPCRATALFRPVPNHGRSSKVEDRGAWRVGRQGRARANRERSGPRSAAPRFRAALSRARAPRPAWRAAD